MGILKKLFEKDPAPRVLDYILNNPDDLLVRHQIEKETGLSYATVERVIYDLVEKGVIVEEEIGERKVYRLNKKNEYAGKLLELFHGRKLVESSPDGLFLVEKESGEIVDVNKGGEELLKLPREKIVDKKYLKFTPEENSQKYKKLFEKFTQEEKKLKEVRSEVGDLYIIDGEDNKVPIDLSGGGTIDIGGLKLTQIIVRDISKRKRAEERFRRLFDSIPDPAFLLDEDGIIREINEIFHKKRDLSEEEIIGSHFKDLPFVPEETEEEAWENFQKRLSEEEVEPYTVRIEGPYGEDQVSEINASVVKDGDQVIGVIGVARDVTERVQAEEKFRQLFQGLPNPAYLVNKEAIIEETNEAACEHLGLDKEEILGSTPLDLVEILDEDGVEKRMMERFEKVKKGEGVPIIEHELRTPDGEIHYVELEAVPFELQGVIKGVVIIVHEITGRKKMEKMLQESEKKYRNITENANDMISFVDFEGKILYANKTHENLLGYNVEELEGKKFFKYLHEDDFENVRKTFEKLKEEREASVEARLENTNGDYRYYEAKGKILSEDENDENRILIISRDITERKKMEEELRESREKYRTLVEQSHDGIFIYRGDRLLFVNNRICEILGYDKEELYDIYVWDLVHPDDRERVKEIGKNRFQGKEVPNTYEARVISKNGETKTLSFAINSIQFEGERAALAAVRDITEKKTAEKELKESRNNYRAIIETAPEALVITDLEGKIAYASPIAGEILGYDSNEELFEMNSLELVAPEDLTEFKEYFRKKLEGEGEKRGEFNLLRRDGTQIPVNVSAGLIRDEEGEPDAFVGIFQNIFDLKKPESSLSTVFHALPNPAYLVDKDGIIEEINAAACERLGLEKEEIIGKSPFDLVNISKETEEKMRKNFEKVIDEKRIKKSTYEMETLDGETIFSEITSVPFSLGGEVIGVVSISQDATDRMKEKE